MKERPILFSSPMVRAILEGRKTQTRRVLKKQPDFDADGVHPAFAGEKGPWFDFWKVGKAGVLRVKCPYGSPGDLIWTRESCAAVEREEMAGILYKADDHWQLIENTRDAADAWLEMHHYRGKRGLTIPPMHMPRAASRITLEITDVRIERLQDISEEDAIADGFASKADFAAYEWCAPIWDSNPFVWAVSFRRIDQAEKSKAA